MLQLPLLQDPDVAVVWFTACDLRTHDHDALVASAGAVGVVPLYVFDDQVRGTLLWCGLGHECLDEHLRYKLFVYMLCVRSTSDIWAYVCTTIILLGLL